MSGFNTCSVSSASTTALSPVSPHLHMRSYWLLLLWSPPTSSKHRKFTTVYPWQVYTFASSQNTLSWAWCLIECMEHGIEISDTASPCWGHSLFTLCHYHAVSKTYPQKFVDRWTLLVLGAANLTTTYLGKSNFPLQLFCHFISPWQPSVTYKMIVMFVISVGIDSST